MADRKHDDAHRPMQGRGQRGNRPGRPLNLGGAVLVEHKLCPACGELNDEHHRCAHGVPAVGEAQPSLDGVEPVSDADNQWFGDMMILQVLSDSDNVNEQEREVLTRWMAASDRPSQARTHGVGGNDGR